MDYLIVVSTCILLLSVHLIQSTSSASVTLSVSPPGNVREGDTLTVTCRSAGMQPLDSLRLVRRIKGTEYEVATNDYLKERYRSAGRYWVTKWDDTQGLVELKISHISGADAGDLGCIHLPSGEGSYHGVIVDVRPTSVSLWYEALDGRWYPASDGDRVQFKKAIRCNVTTQGSDFESRVVITLNGKELIANKVLQTLAEDDNGFSKLVSLGEYSVDMNGQDMSLHRKNFTCTASVPQHEPLSSSILLEVPHKPQITCASVWHARACEENYSITCSGRMYPDMESHVWSWGALPTKEIIDGQSSDPNITRFHASHTVDAHGEHRFKLFIDEVKNRDFGEYHLRVSNSHGSTLSSLRLELEGETNTRISTTAEKIIESIETLQKAVLLESNPPLPNREMIRDDASSLLQAPSSSTRQACFFGHVMPIAAAVAYVIIVSHDARFIR